MLEYIGILRDYITSREKAKESYSKREKGSYSKRERNTKAVSKERIEGKGETNAFRYGLEKEKLRVIGKGILE